MALTLWSSFYDEVMPNLPGAETAIVDNAIRDVAIHFCTKTLIHRVTLDPIVTAAGTTEDAARFDLYYDSHTSVAAILSGYQGTARMDPTSRTALDEGVGVWETRVGTPTHYMQPDHGTVQTYPIPDNAYTLVFKVALAPKRTATGVESFIYERWVEGLASGVLAKLCAIPGKPWTNAEMVVYHTSLYSGALNDAKIQVNKELTTGDLMVRMR